MALLVAPARNMRRRGIRAHRSLACSSIIISLLVAIRFTLLLALVLVVINFVVVGGAVVVFGAAKVISNKQPLMLLSMDNSMELN